MIAQYLDDQYRPWTARRPARELAKNWLTTAVAPVEQRRARKLAAAAASLKLHLGCADSYLDGWVNIDLNRPGRRLDLRWDLRRGLPFPDNSASAVFSEHLFEHIPLDGAMALLAECRRVLVPGGIFRIGVPDLDRYVRAYLGQDPIIEQVRPGRPTRALALAEIFYFYGHRSVYDFETLAVMLKETGFTGVARSCFGEGALRPSPDSDGRRPETLYVEAVA
ncbi:MAG: class I SAM-dependent methyltransferase [Thermomicrobiales bacterium]